MNAHSPIETAAPAAVAIVNGAVIEVPLNRLKASPRNVRKVPHTAASIESRAASIAAKGVLQPLVIEPELGEGGDPTGNWLVTIGEGRRQALRLLASRKRIKKTHLVRCVVDVVNDPAEISLDENVSRTDMHPADQFEAFRDLAERRGWGAEEIGARFGVSAHVVRQRLRLGAISPKLMAVYREDGLTLDQLMAFAVSEDHGRQDQVFEILSYNRAPHAIRRAMTESKVPAEDRRASFVGLEAYGEAGGTILRDLFTEDGGGWLEDAALLDRLTADKLGHLADDLRAREGWRWAEAYLDFPHGHGFRRVYPHPVERTQAEVKKIEAVSEDYDALVTQWSAVEDLPPEIAARFAELEAELEAFGDGHAYDPDDIARGGAFVVLAHDGQVRIERGFIRPQDEAPVVEAPQDEEGNPASDQAPAAVEPEDEVETAGAALSERLVLDLTARRTAALRDALAQDANLALVAVAHALALRTFYPTYDQPTCLELKPACIGLDGHAPDLADTLAGRQIAERHAAWASRLPREADEVWGAVMTLDGGGLLDLIAHCAALTVNAVHVPWDRRPGAWAHAEVLAQAVGLDMTGYWTVTADSYLGRVTKARIGEAVTEAVSAEAASRIADLKKPDMVEAAQGLLAGTGWLPELLRTRSAPPLADESGAVAVAAE
ncbi:ParB/RepB/Spo0J family partition protein [Phenylobacterium aquaticum]|uniref:ParB/RepB/Spo0J family partition protein n=1 Tax=Phenylobacterium aquaticum TaxID=1763816 RepID=UPI001F5C319D|nr:ParB/Srx family N-terminal domain-containing protein [Phenylobacterium aquaticum]MCI3132870.1 ParB/Srx family N-terminal domain-containing protein [Phenylobacterium aquaticum]